MKARIYRGLTNRWVFWSSETDPSGDVATFFGDRYVRPLGVQFVAARPLPLGASLGPLLQSASPVLPPDAKSLIEVAFRDDAGAELTKREVAWPDNLYAVRKPTGVMPDAPDRDSRIWREDLTEGAQKLLSAGRSLFETALWIAGGVAIVWVISKQASVRRTETA